MGVPSATPTPMPLEINPEPVDPPDLIQNLLDVAYNEWQTVNGKNMGGKNKYTTWYNNYDWGNNAWCAGFVTYCMLEAGIPQDTMENIQKGPEEAPEPVYHVKGSTPKKLFLGYLHMHRTTHIPQRGFVVLYGDGKSNGNVHVGLVFDAVPLGDGTYRLTTIEGAMRNTVRMYVYDYDPNAEDIKKNIIQVPKDERLQDDTTTFTYEFHRSNKSSKVNWYVRYFLMPWDPGQ